MRYYFFLIIFIMVIYTDTNQEIISNNNRNYLLKQAKKSLFEREKRYLKIKPLSEDLKEFIGKVRESRFSKPNRKRRTEKEHMIKVGLASNSNLEPIAEEPQSNLETVVKRSNDDIYDSTKTTTENPADRVLFEKVLQDVDKLVKFKNLGKLQNKEGALCNVKGAWDSDAGGALLNITVEGCECGTGVKDLCIKVMDRDPATQEGFLCDGEWSLYGQLPFAHSTLLVVRGFHHESKKALTFIGECRICEGSETLTGMWMIGRASKDCKDREATHLVVSDIWRRNHVKSLHDRHLAMLSTKMEGKSECNITIPCPT